MPEANDYLAKAEESLASAEGDFSAGRYNSCTRSCYYAMFQAAIAALIHEGIRPARGRWEHRYVHAQFSGQLVYRRRLYPPDLRRTLLDLYDLRVKADYQAGPVARGQARRALDMAVRMVSLVKESIK